MKHIITIRKDGDKFPEVGGSHRQVVHGALVHAMRYAARWAKQSLADARIESWPDDQFYKSDPTSVRYYDWETGFFSSTDHRRKKETV